MSSVPYQRQFGTPVQGGGGGGGGSVATGHILRATSSTLPTAAGTLNDLLTSQTWTLADGAATAGWSIHSTPQNLQLPTAMPNRLVLGIEAVLKEGGTIRDRVLLTEYDTANRLLHGSGSSVVQADMVVTGGIQHLRLLSNGVAITADTTVEIYEVTATDQTPPEKGDKGDPGVQGSPGGGTSRTLRATSSDLPTLTTTTAANTLGNELSGVTWTLAEGARDEGWRTDAVLAQFADHGGRANLSIGIEAVLIVDGVVQDRGFVTEGADSDMPLRTATVGASATGVLIQVRAEEDFVTLARAGRRVVRIAGLNVPIQANAQVELWEIYAVVGTTVISDEDKARIPAANPEGNKVWKTDTAGTPGWRDDESGGGGGGGASLASNSEFETGTSTTKAPTVKQVVDGLSAAENILVRWNGADGSPLDESIPVPTRTGETSDTAWDSTNNRWTVLDGSSTARGLVWSNDQVDWSAFAMAVDMEQSSHNWGLALFWGTEATSPDDYGDIRNTGASGFMFEINDNGVTSGGVDYTEFLLYANPGSGQPRVTSGITRSNGTLSPSSSRAGYERVPVTGRMRVMIVQLGQKVELYVNRTLYLTYDLTEAQAGSGTGAQFGIMGAGGSSSKRAYISQIYIGSPSIALAARNFSPGADAVAVADATETVAGVVEGADSTEETATSGTAIRGWSVARLRAQIRSIFSTDTEARIPAASPGNNLVWKTDGSGVPGWRADATGGGGGGTTSPATDAQAGIVRGATSTESTATSGTAYLAWSIARLRAQIRSIFTTALEGRIPTTDEKGRIPAASPGNNQVWKTDNAGTPGWRDDATGGGGAALATDTQFTTGSDTLAPTVNQTKRAAEAAASIFVAWFGDDDPTEANAFDPSLTPATIAAYATTSATTLYRFSNKYWTLHRANIATGRGKIGPLYWDNNDVNFRRFAVALKLRSTAQTGNAGWNDFFWGAGTNDFTQATDSWAGTADSGAFVRIKRLSTTQMSVGLRVRDGTRWKYLDNSDTDQAMLRNGTTAANDLGTNGSATIPIRTTDDTNYIVDIVVAGRQVNLYINKICWVTWLMPLDSVPGGTTAGLTWGPRFGIYPDAGPNVGTALSSRLYTLLLGQPDPVNIDPDGRFSNSLSSTSIEVLDFSRLSDLSSLDTADDVMVYDTSARRLKRMSPADLRTQFAPPATESTAGVVEAVSQTEAQTTAGTAVRGWSTTRLGQWIANLLPTVTQTDAEAGTGQERRIWSAVRVRQAIRSVFSTAIEGRIPSANPGNNQVWRTDGSGAAGWRDEAAQGPEGPHGGGWGRTLRATSSALPTLTTTTAANTLGNELSGVTWTLASGADDAGWREIGNVLAFADRGGRDELSLGVAVELEVDGTIEDRGFLTEGADADMPLRTRTFGAMATGVQVLARSEQDLVTIAQSGRRALVVAGLDAPIQANAIVKVYEITAREGGTATAATDVTAGIVRGADSTEATATTGTAYLAWSIARLREQIRSIFSTDTEARIPAASPGNNQVWSTDGSGTPGWRAAQAGSVTSVDGAGSVTGRLIASGSIAAVTSPTDHGQIPITWTVSSAFSTVMRSGDSLIGLPYVTIPSAQGFVVSILENDTLIGRGCFPYGYPVEPTIQRISNDVLGFIASSGFARISVRVSEQTAGYQMWFTYQSTDPVPAVTVQVHEWIGGGSGIKSTLRLTSGTLPTANLTANARLATTWTQASGAATVGWASDEEEIIVPWVSSGVTTSLGFEVVVKEGTTVRTKTMFASADRGSGVGDYTTLYAGTIGITQQYLTMHVSGAGESGKLVAFNASQTTLPANTTIEIYEVYI